MNNIITNAYESVLVVSCKQGEEAVKSVVDKFRELIEANAAIDSVDEWGVRRLAYPINKENEGYYVIFNFTSQPDFIKELERVYNITDGVLRSMVFRKVG